MLISVTPAQMFATCAQRPAAPFSRTSVGLDLTSAILGSEGCLGIITSVVVKVVPLPEVSEHASFFFRDFTVSDRVPSQHQHMHVGKTPLHKR